MATTDPNPQDWAFAEYEAPQLIVAMTPAEDITGQTFTLTVRRALDDTVMLALTTFTVTSISAGVFHFTLTSTQTGVTIGTGDYLYDVWRTDAGFEKQLVYGILHVRDGQWK